MRNFIANAALLACCSLPLIVARLSAQGPERFGEVRFEGGNWKDRISGVWIDRRYVGSVKELHGGRKVLLPAGLHEISVRQPGYYDSTTIIMLEPDQLQTVQVNMHPSPPPQPLDVIGLLNFRVHPGRAVVLIDDKYLGQASQFSRSTRSMPLFPGTHRIKIELPGYRPFETEVTLAAGQTSEVKTELVRLGEDTIQ